MIGGKTKSLYFCRRMSPWRLPFDGFLHFEKMNTAQPSIPVVLITGASSGIGRATARQLHERGCRVYGAARRVERMADLQEAGIGVLPLDVTRSESACACVEAVVEREGRIDVLINNAGYGLYGAVEDVSLDDARRQLEVNLIGPALMTQLVLPYMRRQGRGRIVNVSSMAGKVYTAYGAWYHASKFGLEGWSDSLRLELKPFGIDVVLGRHGPRSSGAECPQGGLSCLGPTRGRGDAPPLCLPVGYHARQIGPYHGACRPDQASARPLPHRFPGATFGAGAAVIARKLVGCFHPSD